MRHFFLAAALFGGLIFTSEQARTNGLKISLAPTVQAAAPYAAPFMFYAVATGALFACGTAAALAGIDRQQA
jgi:hypothetical protein